MPSEPINRFVTVFAVCALVSACATQAPQVQQPELRAPADFPLQYYRDALAQERPVYRVDPKASLVVIEVRRGGSLARLGHDHVVASHDVQGYVAPGEGRADLYVRLDRLVVDEPELRVEAKFDTQPSEDDIAGTRRNMLNELQAEEYPFALIRVTRAAADGGDRLSATITLHGTRRTLEVPVRIEIGLDAVSVNGSLALNQTDFGIKPLSVLGGAVQVQDRVEVRFRIRAARLWRASDA